MTIQDCGPMPFNTSYYVHMKENASQKRQAPQGYKYCPRVTAVSCTQKTPKKSMWPWPMTLKFNTFLEVVEFHVCAKFHQTKCSGLWVIV